MRAVFLACLLVSSPASAFGLLPDGGTATPLPACTATPPSQASAVGLTTLKKCDSFVGSNSVADTNNLQLPKFDWFPASPVTSVAITPPNNFTNDGTGLNIIQSALPGAVATQSLLTVGRSTSSPYYVGVPTSGSYYVEIDAKFNPATPAGATIGNTPAFFSTESLHSLNGVNDPSKYPFTEVDVMECIPSSTGNPCTLNQQLHVWKDVGGVTTNSCSSHGGSAAMPTFANYNTYGFLHLNAADNGGTGRLQWYINNSSTLTCSYTSTSMSCTDGAFSPSSGQSCLTSDLYNSMETQQIPFIVNAGNPNYGITVRNFHVWQLN